MPADSRKYLVGLVGPDVLEAAEKDLFHPVRLDLDCCDAIEIRYDFFDESEWESLSERVRHVVPSKLQIGTIRLKRDGGKFADARVVERLDLWKKILSARQVPEWLDLERDCLSDFKALNDMAYPIGVGLATACTSSQKSSARNSRCLPPSAWAKPAGSAAFGR